MVNPDSLSTRTTPSRSSTESSATATRIALTTVEPESRLIGSSTGCTRTTGTSSCIPLSRVSPRSWYSIPSIGPARWVVMVLARISPGAARLHSRAARLSAPPR